MNNYDKKLPAELAKALQEAGMENEQPSYYDAAMWLVDRSISVNVEHPHMKEHYGMVISMHLTETKPSWEGAMNSAIAYALKLIRL